MFHVLAYSSREEKHPCLRVNLFSSDNSFLLNSIASISLSIANSFDLDDVSSKICLECPPYPSVASIYMPSLSESK